MSSYLNPFQQAEESIQSISLMFNIASISMVSIVLIMLFLKAIDNLDEEDKEYFKSIFSFFKRCKEKRNTTKLKNEIETLSNQVDQLEVKYQEKQIPEKSFKNASIPKAKISKKDKQQIKFKNKVAYNSSLYKKGSR